MRNPPWNRDELILALDLYFREPSARGSKTHPEVVALSELLSQLAVHESTGRAQTFRNPNGVSMKLSNFLPLDPDYTGKGLEAGGKTDRLVWDEFAGDIHRLRLTAVAIRLNLQDPKLITAPPLDEDEVEASEGRILTRIHRYRERDSSIVRRKKQQVLKKTACLACEACGFDFVEFYGELGEGFIECHHSKPVSELNPGEKTRIRDLRIVCSNCHRMIHKRRPWLTLEELRERVRTRR